jgi:hypothetical protein
MYKVTLTKLSGGTRIRTDEVVGQCHMYPAIGKSFSMIAPPIVEGSIAREVTTSTVQDVIVEDDGVIIETLNSKYHLHFN